MDLMLTAEGLGADCIPRTEDDPINEAPCEADPWGWMYQEDLCACTAQYTCADLAQPQCEPDVTILHPITKCECISLEEYDSFYEAAAAAGPDCILGNADDDDNNVGDDDCADPDYEYNY